MQIRNKAKPKMIKRLSKVVASFAVAVTMVSTMSIPAFAGVSSSPGSSVKGGGLGRGAKYYYDTSIGPGKGKSSGIRWSPVYNGNVQWSSDLHYHPEDLSPFYTQARKWICVQKDVRKKGWHNFKWKWWYRYLGDPSRYGTKKLRYYNYADGAWCNRHNIVDTEILQAVRQSGYNWNSGRSLWTNGSQHVDIAWVSSVQKSEANQRWTIYKVWDGNNLITDNSHRTAEDLYNHPTTEVTYKGKTGVNDYHYSRTYYATYMLVTRKRTYTNDGNGHIGNDKNTYSKGSETSYYTGTVTYDLTPPDVTQDWYRPSDLNRNGLANDDDVKQTYPEYNNPKGNVDVTVDNYIGQTDGSYLKTLDTNNRKSFLFKVNSGILGLPLNIKDSMPGGDKYNQADGSYNSSVMGDVGVASNSNNGVMKFNGGNNTDIYGQISNDFMWGGGAYLAVSDNNASIEYGGTEKVGSEGLNVPRDWRGGNMNFRSIHVGKYNLMSGGNRPWWEMTYEKGKFYTYGVEYQGKITISGVQAPSVINKGFYTRLASKQLVQPLVRGLFDVSTVAGDLRPSR